MPTITTRPSSTIIGSGTVTGPSLWGALADDSDATFITLAAPSFFSVGVPTASLPAGSRWRTMKVRLRVKSDGGSPAWVTFSLLVSGAEQLTTQFATSSTTFIEQASPSMTVPAGTFGVKVRMGWAPSYVSPDDGVFAEAYVDWLYATAPTCAVDGPTGLITATTQPAISWTHTAGTDGGPQVAAEVKVYNDAQYGATGFNPDIAAAFWSTSVTGPTNTVTPGVQLVDDDYRVYVRTAQSINGVNHWSSWDFEAFSVSTTPPPAPTLTATGDNVGAKTRLVGVIDETVSSILSVQSSADGGTTWDPVRGASRITVVGETWAGYDYESGNGVETQYRAQAIRPTVNGDIASAWSTVATATWASDEVWLKSPERPSLNRTITLVSPQPQTTRTSRNGLFDVLGRSNRVVVRDARGSIQTTLTIETYTLDEKDAIEEMLGADSDDPAPVLLVQPPVDFGLPSMYIDVGDVQGIPQTQLVHPWWTWVVPVTRVDRPTDAGIDDVGGLTIDDLGDLYATGDDIPATLTYLDFV
jgi:hypothetical protein